MGPSVHGLLLLALAAAGSDPGRACLEAHRFTLDEAAPPALAAELCAGLFALPPSLRMPPAPLHLQWHEQARPFGLGDGTDLAPEWSDEGATFHLYALGPSLEHHASLRVAGLRADEFERLWRRRAIVHALIVSHDRALGLSAREDFRRAFGWKPALDRLLPPSEHHPSRYVGAFSRVRGREAPGLDLATFAEEALWPPEALRPDSIAVDDRVGCQELTKSRWLQSFLRTQLPADAPTPLPRGTCPALEAFVDAERLDGLEVVLAAPSRASPESIFGHVMLRPRRPVAEPWQSDATAWVVQLAALVAPRTGGFAYLVDGATGGFDNTVMLVPWDEVLRQNQEIEGRSLRRFPLALTHEEQVFVLERVFELERRGYTAYRFFTDNCARSLVELFASALPGVEIEVPGTLWTMPTEVLDALADARVLRGTSRAPLLSASPIVVPSNEDRAAAALAAREVRLGALRRGSPPSVWAALEEASEQALDGDPQVRTAAYASFAAVGRPLAAANADVRAPLLALLEAHLFLERTALDRAEAEAFARELQRIEPPPGLTLPTSAELVARRQRLFEHEDAAERLHAARQELSLLEDLWRTAARRAPSSADEAAIDRVARTRVAFAAIVEEHAHLAEQLPPSPPTPSTELRLEVDEPIAPLPSSGAARFGLVLGALVDEGGVTPAIGLRTAAVLEPLGELRERGFGVGKEVRLLDGELRAGLPDGRPSLLDWEVTLVGVRSSIRELPVHREGVLDHVGLGAFVTNDSRAARLISQRTAVRLEGIAALHQAPLSLGYTLLAFGPAFEGRIGRGLERFAGVAAAHLELAHRTSLGGSSARAFTGRLVWQSGLAGGRAFLGDVHEARAELALDWELGAARDPALLLGPRLWAEWERGATVGERREAFAGLGGLLP